MACALLSSRLSARSQPPDQILAKFERSHGGRPCWPPDELDRVAGRTYHKMPRSTFPPPPNLIGNMALRREVFELEARLHFDRAGLAQACVIMPAVECMQVHWFRNIWPRLAARIDTHIISPRHRNWHLKMPQQGSLE